LVGWGAKGGLYCPPSLAFEAFDIIETTASNDTNAM